MKRLSRLRSTIREASPRTVLAKQLNSKETAVGLPKENGYRFLMILALLFHAPFFIHFNHHNLGNAEKLIC